MSKVRFALSHVAIAISLLIALIASMHAIHLSRKFEKRDIRRETLANWIEGTVSACVVTDGRGFILDWNPAAETRLGWSREEMIGVNIACIMPKGLADRHADRFDSGFWKNHDVMRLRCWVLAKSGDPIHVSLAIRPSLSNKDRFFGLIFDDADRCKDVGDQEKPESVGQQELQIDHGIRQRRLP